ncbi:MAG TPA: efflux RND transporter permease subunit [Vicinamibacteria bacterium]|nr:efflux RND transporter permease subunit [Vicinamibacteria bacterium]
MNLAEGFIRRPVATTLVMAAILFAGIGGYRLLPVSDLPNVDFPTIQVVATLPGANPDTMAASVATPLEKQFSTIAGLDSMSSVNALGLTQITLQFALDRNIDAAGQDVQAAIGKASSQLPPTMANPPSYQKVNPADSPVIFMSIHSPTRPLSEVDFYAQTLVAQRVSMISGVAQVGVIGSQKYAVRVQLDPSALASRGVGIDEVTTAIQRGNVNLPTGTLSGANEALTVEANGQLTNAAAYRPLVVTYRNGSPVRLEDLGKVVDGVENDKVASWFMTEHGPERGITLTIQRQPGANTVAVVQAIRELLPSFRQRLPASVQLDVLFDRSRSIKESVDDVKFTLLLTVGLVIMVIFMFLRNVPATIIPSLALPMSIVGTFFAMYLLGYSLDNLSLMALTLSVGFVVDDAIVMLENIVRHIEDGEPPMEAALKGSKEVSFTILSMTISLVAVFLPVLFMGGLLGRLLHEFAVTISAAILVSGFVSLTLTPMLCSRFLKAQPVGGPKSDHHGGRLFEAVRRGYEKSLRAVLGRTRLVLGVAAIILVATGWLFVRMPKGFLPTEDNGQLLIYAEAAQGVSFDAMAAHQKKLADIMAKEPGIEAFNSSIGASGSTNTMNSGRVFARLSPREERPSAQKIVESLRPKFAEVPGIRAFPQILPPIRIGGLQTKSLYQLTLQGSDTAELYRVAPLLEERMRTLPGLVDVTSDLQIKSPQIHVEIDRDRAISLGVTAQQVEEALYTAFGTRQVSTIYAPDNQYRVITELLPEFQRDPATMGLLHVRSSTGALVPLEAVAHLSRRVSPLLVNHLGQLPAVTLSFNLKPGTSLGEGVDRVTAAAREILPASISTSFQGAAQAFEASMRGLGWLLLLAILVIYIVLGILYESFIHPLTILSGLPAAGFGALVTLSLFGEDLNVYSFVGVIMLVGIVKKNAIMMIDFAIEAQRHGKAAKEAIFEGCLVRFRPIMMTTMCALAGTLPIALGIGAGAESRRPLGLAVVGGLLFSQFLTLYLTPVFYLTMEKVRSRIGRREERALAAA